MTSIDTLHILNKHPGHPAFRSCLSSLASGDALLLTENGVLALADQELTLKGSVFALIADVQARAISTAGTGASVIDYEEMVALTTRANRVISW